MKKYKTIITFFAANLLFFSLLLVALYVYDPLQIFHKRWFYKAPPNQMRLHKNMRQQAKGVIDNYDFDSVILGTSMLENTSADEASKLLGGKFVNLSMSGSDFYERAIVLKYLLKKKKVKTIIYSVDYYYYNRRKGYPKYPLSGWVGLYDQSILNNFKIYLNKKFVYCALTLSSSKKCIGKRNSLDKPNEWFSLKRHNRRFGGIVKWITYKNDEQIQHSLKQINAAALSKQKKTKKNPLKSIDRSKEYIDEFILDIAKKNPDVKFNLIFPPYSRTLFATWGRTNKTKYSVYTSMIDYLAKSQDGIKNIAVFNFDNEEFPDDISVYKDLTHYHPKINSYMLKKIKQNKNRVTQATASNLIKHITYKTMNFDFDNLLSRLAYEEKIYDKNP